MYLHDDVEDFKERIKDCHDHVYIDEAMIEKDYFVTLFLKHLFETEPNVVFKGGTCLSKCHKLIDRFSEDIDITMRPNATQKQKRGLKYNIIDTANKLGLQHTNADTIFSGRSYAEHVIAYPSQFANEALKPFLLVETFFRPTTLPTLTLPASSLLYEHLKGNDTDNVIPKFDLEPFDISVQSLQVTFIDKLLALNSNYLKRRIERYSRHLYDLHMILPYIEFSKEFFELLEEIGEFEKSDLAKMRVPINFDPSGLAGSLREIISKDVYKEDYENVTMPLLFRKVPYDEAISSLRTAVDKMHVEEGEFKIDLSLNFTLCRRTAKV